MPFLPHNYNLSIDEDPYQKVWDWWLIEGDRKEMNKTKLELTNDMIA